VQTVGTTSSGSYTFCSTRSKDTHTRNIFHWVDNNSRHHHTDSTQALLSICRMSEDTADTAGGVGGVETAGAVLGDVLSTEAVLGSVPATEVLSEVSLAGGMDLAGSASAVAPSGGQQGGGVRVPPRFPGRSAAIFRPVANAVRVTVPGVITRFSNVDWLRSFASKGVLLWLSVVFLLVVMAVTAAVIIYIFYRRPHGFQVSRSADVDGDITQLSELISHCSQSLNDVVGDVGVGTEVRQLRSALSVVATKDLPRNLSLFYRHAYLLLGNPEEVVVDDLLEDVEEPNEARGRRKCVNRRSKAAELVAGGECDATRALRGKLARRLDRLDLAAWRRFHTDYKTLKQALATAVNALDRWGETSDSRVPRRVVAQIAELYISLHHDDMARLRLGAARAGLGADVVQGTLFGLFTLYHLVVERPLVCGVILPSWREVRNTCLPTYDKGLQEAIGIATALARRTLVRRWLELTGQSQEEAVQSTLYDDLIVKVLRAYHIPTAVWGEAVPKYRKTLGELSAGPDGNQRSRAELELEKWHAKLEQMNEKQRLGVLDEWKRDWLEAQLKLTDSDVLEAFVSQLVGNDAGMWSRHRDQMERAARKKKKKLVARVVTGVVSLGLSEGARAAKDAIEKLTKPLKDVTAFVLLLFRFLGTVVRKPFEVLILLCMLIVVILAYIVMITLGVTGVYHMHVFVVDAIVPLVKVLLGCIAVVPTALLLLPLTLLDALVRGASRGSVSIQQLFRCESDPGEWYRYQDHTGYRRMGLCWSPCPPGFESRFGVCGRRDTPGMCPYAEIMRAQKGLGPSGPVSPTEEVPIPIKAYMTTAKASDEYNSELQKRASFLRECDRRLHGIPGLLPATRGLCVGLDTARHPTAAQLCKDLFGRDARNSWWLKHPPPPPADSDRVMSSSSSAGHERLRRAVVLFCLSLCAVLVVLFTLDRR